MALSIGGPEMKRWRLIENEWNLRCAPWSDAIGIEEIDDAVEVPGIVCWFTRGWNSKEAAEEVVMLHNELVEPR